MLNLLGIATLNDTPVVICDEVADGKYRQVTYGPLPGGEEFAIDGPAIDHNMLLSHLDTLDNGRCPTVEHMEAVYLKQLRPALRTVMNMGPGRYMVST